MRKKPSNTPYPINRLHKRYQLQSLYRLELETLEDRTLPSSTPTSFVDMEIVNAVEDQLTNLLEPLDAAANQLAGSGLLSEPLPVVGQSLNDLLGENRDWGDLLQLGSTVTNYFAGFDPTNPLFDESTIGQQPTAAGIRDAIISQLSIPGFTGIGGDPIVSISGGLNDETEQLNFTVCLNAELTASTDLQLDAIGSDWSSLGVSFDAGTQVDVTTTVDLMFSFSVGLGQANRFDTSFNLDRFNINAGVNADNSTLNFSIGPVDGSITASRLRLAGSAAVSLTPGPEAFIDRITVAAGPPDAQGKMLDLDFAFNAGLVLNGSSVGPALSATATISDTDLFDSTLPTVVGNLDDLQLDVSASDVITGLLTLADHLDVVSSSDVMSTTIPLLNKTLAEVLNGDPEPREFGSAEISAISTPTENGDFKEFTVTLNTASANVPTNISRLGLRPGDTVQYQTSTGDRLDGTVSAIGSNTITIQYPKTRTDTPDSANPRFSFQVDGALSSILKGSLGSLQNTNASQSVPTLAELFNEFGGPLGLTIDNAAYDDTDKLLTFTLNFQPDTIAFVTRLDFGTQIDPLEFNASGDFLLGVSPTIKLPIGLRLGKDLPVTTPRIFLSDPSDEAADFHEVTLNVNATLDNPQARAGLGLLSGLLQEDSSIADNDGIVFDTTFTVDIDKAGDDEIALSEVPDSLTAGLSGSLNIDGVQIKPEVAGVSAIPGQIDIYTTTDGSTRGPAGFTTVSELTDLFSKIVINGSLGDFSELTPEAVVTMFIQLGDSLQQLSGTLDVPDGIPFVDEAISEVVDFVSAAQGFARNLYFNPRIIADSDIAVSNGVLSADASFAIRVEADKSYFVTVPASATTTNTNLDDLIADINAALTAANLNTIFVAERLLPFTSAEVTDITNVTDDALPNHVAPLNGYHRYRIDFASSVNLFNLGVAVGDVIEYLDTDGNRQQARIDDMSLSSMHVRFESSQTAPQTGAGSLVSLYNEADENKLTIRTTDSGTGISMEMSTLQVTANSPSPSSGRVTDDVTFSVVLDGTSVDVTISAADMADNLQPADLLADLNAAFAATDNDSQSTLDKKVQALLVGDAQEIIRIAVVDAKVSEMSITGAEELGFSAPQNQDANTATTELGLSVGQTQSAKFRINTIQDLVHTINGLVQQQFKDTGFSTALNYVDAAMGEPASVEFNIAFAKSYEQSIDLGFTTGLDIGFTDLDIVGNANAMFSVNAGVELGVGIDLARPGSGQTVSDTTRLADLDGGQGVQLKVGLKAANSVNSSGRNQPATPLTLAIDIERQNGSDSLNQLVTVPAAHPSLRWIPWSRC